MTGNGLDVENGLETKASRPWQLGLAIRPGLLSKDQTVKVFL